jgi:hypothetical protein
LKETRSRSRARFRYIFSMLEKILVFNIYETSGR